MNTIIRLFLITSLALLPQFLCSSAAMNGGSASSKDVSQEIAKEGEDYTLYVVKWYETLDDVAQKFGVSKELLIRFNSLEGEKLSRHQELMIPKEKGKKTEEVEKTVNILDTLNKKVDQVIDKVQQTFEQVKNPKVSLVLPLNSTGEEVNNSSYEFYSGVLLALRDLSSEGKNVRLNVVDCSSNYSPLDFFLGENLVIGPFSKTQIETTLNRCTESTTVVSPLDPRTASLAESHPNFYLAPSSVGYQYASIAEWIRSDSAPGDEVLVLSEKGAKPSALRDSLISKGIAFKEFSYGILEGMEVLDVIDSLFVTPGITTRIAIVSDNEAFVNDAVRNSALLTFKGHDVILYSNSKIRNYDTIEPEDLHKLNAHVCCSYFINYDDVKIKKFLLEYRALFEEEPSQFSFQGYDLASFFIRCILNGKNFDGEWEGLQSDFRFEQEGDGHVNVAIRRIIYGDNYSVALLR